MAFFEFTFPSGVKQEGHKVFRENQFPFVKKIVDVGHVHHYRASGKLISNGSFDRLCHGEEEPKGLIRLLDYPDHYTAQFIENKNAAIWDTLVFTKDDTTETIRARIGEHLAKITSDRIISLRFTIDTIDHRDAIKAWMKEVHPHISVKFKKSKEDEDKQALIPSSLLFAPVEKRVSPTPATIATFIRAHIPEDYPLTVDDIEGYLEPVLEKA